MIALLLFSVVMCQSSNITNKECIDKALNNATMVAACSVVIPATFSVFTEPNNELCSSSCKSLFEQTDCLSGLATVRTLVCLKNSNDYCLSKEILPTLVSFGLNVNNSNSTLANAFFRFATNKTSCCSTCAAKATLLISTNKSVFPVEPLILTAALSQINETCFNHITSSDKALNANLLLLFLIAAF
jgi:hypothetical protein